MKRHLFKYLSVFIYPAVDFLLVAFSITLSYKFYRISGIGKGIIYPKIAIIPVSLFIGLAAVVVMHFFDVYKKTSSILNVEEIKNVIKGITVTFTLVVIVLVFGELNLSRYVIIFSYISSLVLLVTGKTIFYHTHLLADTGILLRKKVIIYGAGNLGQALFREIANSPKLNIAPVGFIDDDPKNHGKVFYPSGFYSTRGLAVLGGREDIRRLKEKMGFDEVFLAISNIDYDQLTSVLDFLKGENIKVAFVPNLYKIFLHKLHIVQVGQIPLIQEEDETSFTPYLYVKKYIDFVMAIFVFILLLPLLLIIAAAIKIDSAGPILFQQERVGKDGRLFTIYKFRSMYPDADPYAVNPLCSSDPRITRAGRFLRKTSLDELPQIVNVINGTMSFVGPRPEMPFIVKTYNEVHKKRLKVLPGITGLWQLSGDRNKAIHENMDYDLYYVRNVSFFLDIAILIETIVFAFRGI